MSVNTCMASLARQFRFFPLIQRSRVRNAPNPVGWVGGWGAGRREVGLLAVLLSVFFSRMQPLSQGLWVLCAEMGVAWHILGVGQVSDP